VSREKQRFVEVGVSRALPLSSLTRVSLRRAYSVRTIGHFLVPAGLCFKTRLSDQPWIWKSFFILMQIKLIFTRKSCAPSLILKASVFGTSRKWPIIIRDLFGGGGGGGGGGLNTEETRLPNLQMAISSFSSSLIY